MHRIHINNNSHNNNHSETKIAYTWFDVDQPSVDYVEKFDDNDEE